MKSVVRDGRGMPRVEDVPRPAPRSGHVLVRTCASLVSAGTERAATEFAGLSLAAKAARRPDLVWQVADKVRRDGVWEAQRAVRARLNIADSLGYSCAGIVEQDGTAEHPPGSLVACAGGGHAAHAEYNLVPRNLVAAVPQGVPVEDAAFATLGSVALHAVRLSRCGLGDDVAVVGLGLIGQIAAQLLAVAGCRVFGLDPASQRSALAAELGCRHVGSEPESLARTIAEQTRHRGVDAVLIAAAAHDSAPVTSAAAFARGRARIVVIGDTQLQLDRRSFYEKELRLVVSRSYGPGRYDRAYEEKGVDYPYEYVRWTLQRNMEAFLALAPQLRLQPLVSHRFDIASANQAYELLHSQHSQTCLGILLRYPEPSTPTTASISLAGSKMPARGPVPRVGVSVIGAGNFARATLLPALERIDGIRRHSIVSAKGLTAWASGRRFAFELCSTDPADALGPETELVIVATRHGEHASLAREALARGKAVFVEKPVCVSEEELDAIAADYTSAAGRPFLMVGYNRRFAPLILQLKDFLGKVGRPLILSYRVNAGPLPKGSWVLDANEGGGRIVGEACHFVDLMMHLAGSRPCRIHAVRPTADGRLLDSETFTATVEFANGSVGTLLYSADGDPAHPKERLEIIGGGAVIILDELRSLSVRHNSRRRRVRTWGRDRGHADEIRATVDAVRAGAAEPIPFAEALATMRATFAITRSLALGAPVSLEP